jgi:hypothetical protein
MDALRALELRSNISDEEAMTEILDTTQELTEGDQRKGVSATKHDDQHSEEETLPLTPLCMSPLIRL